MIVIIPTHNRYELLKRTIKSISLAKIPEDLKSIIVIENGKKCGSESLVKEYLKNLPIKYEYSEKPNKSIALNKILSNIEKEFIVFLDDDVRISEDTIIQYSNAIKSMGEKNFYCGKCLVDYEKEPDEWLKKYLPPSAVGWDLGDKIVRLNAPDALGFNWGAYSENLKICNGFDSNRGPGTLSRGQETEMQRKLLNIGIYGYYIPEAIVWHYVPKGRCTKEWSLNRINQKCTDLGMLSFKENKIKVCFKYIFLLGKICVLKSFLIFAKLLLNDKIRFKYEYELEKYFGYIKGIRIKVFENFKKNK